MGRKKVGVVTAEHLAPGAWQTAVGRDGVGGGGGRSKAKGGGLHGAQQLAAPG